MGAKVLNGRALAKRLRDGIAEDVAAMVANGQRPPALAVILVGNDPASEIYVNLKRRDCEQVGMRCDIQHLEDSITQEELERRVAALNADPEVDGILVQVPLPEHIRADRIIDIVDPAKDVDGFHPYNIGRLALRRPALRPGTPKGIMQLLEQTRVPLRGLDATILGASNHVGRPMGLELLLAGCTVTTAHKFSKDTKACARSADILISAVGKPGLVPGDWIKPGAIVVDIGITRTARGKLHGDVIFDEACEVASWITPVPGGVGPMTRVAMMQNTLMAARAEVD
ncbi:MAG: bifunctional methylenetetrahydrofolate dehydrogenase/methenyltetrahydrofolate cyclohydrolase FolD [Gammaproteobacteria bacterium]|nr:bifunctional methylenetetrahydrofolate dehydrogenase/methenyltetrahydrofolate cyclohydrolase FolD [Gammaproteobacteria bacterium]